MGRALRISGPGAMHHIISRCNNEEFLFLNNEDFKTYLETVAKYKKEFKFKLYHYALLHNHAHLQIEIGEKSNASKIMQIVNGEYARWYNCRYSRKGHFWRERFRSTLIEDETYFLRCGIYIELNAVRAGLVGDPYHWQFCSIRKHTEGEKNKLVDTSHVYLSLGRNEKERKEEYKQMLDSELTRTKEFQQAINKKDRKAIRRLLQTNCKKPIPFKRKITKLFNRGISNVITTYY